MMKEYGLPEDQKSQSRTQLAAFITAIIVCFLISEYLGVCYFARSGNQSDVVLESRINPNTALSASLVRLPNIGPRRAAAIIDYRENVDEGPVFEKAEDLQKIKGIGPKTVEGLRAWVVFE